MIATVALASVWHVPGEIATIQAALDTLSTGDTILVEAGTYSESLVAPDSTFFVMQGVVNPNGDPQRPVIDPSALDSARYKPCLNMPYGSEAIIDNIVFYNGAHMYPRTRVGGIRNNAVNLTIRNCLFDSTFLGLSPNRGTLVVDSCIFVDNVTNCIDVELANQVTITNSIFAGTGMLMTLRDSTLLQNCSFRKRDGGEWISVSGESVTIRDCNFIGESDSVYYAIIWAAEIEGFTFENNTLENLLVTGGALMFNGEDGDTSYISHNTFHDIHATTLMGCAALLQGTNLVVNDNIFDGCHGFTADGHGSIQLSLSSAELKQNRFLNMDNTSPAIALANCPNVNMHNCFFEPGTWALDVFGAAFDAELNWWGDSTGPRHQDWNPDGLGSRITGNADFDPWLTDTILAVSERREILFPNDIALAAYPNPFNPTTTISFDLPQASRVKLTIYNILGRGVATLADQMTEAGTHAITWNAQDFPTGLYIARLKAGDHSKTIKMILLR